MATCKGLFFCGKPNATLKGRGVGVLAMPKHAVCTFANRKRAQRLAPASTPRPPNFAKPLVFSANCDILIKTTTQGEEYEC